MPLLVLILSGSISVHAQFQEPPTITLLGNSSRIVSVGADLDGKSLGTDESSTAAGPFVEKFEELFVGTDESFAQMEASQNTTISRFSIRGSGNVGAFIDSGPAGLANGLSSSNIVAFFKVAVDAPFSLSGTLDSGIASSEQGLSQAWAQFRITGTDENDQFFIYTAQSNSFGSSGGEVPIVFSGSVKEDSEVVLDIVASGSVSGSMGPDASAQASFEFDLDFGDRDGDGLLDGWEENGIDLDGMLPIDIDLRALGADPDRKDIFVEVDVMAGTVHSPGPVEDWVEIQDVMDAFAIAPGSLVLNPIPQAGNIAQPTIKLHVIDGGHTPSHQPLSSLGKWPDQFDAIKAANFGQPMDTPEVKAVKKMVFRYCLWADTLVLEGTPGSGVGERPGNDFVVASRFVQAQYPTVLTDALAGTFMHELGHNLSLQHGGQDSLRYKPNYLSVMSYTYQNPWDVMTNQGTNAQQAWLLDYSRKTSTTLDESSLKETEPVAGTPGRQMIFNSNPPTSPGSALNLSFANAPTTDWNFSQGTPQSNPYPLDISRVDWNELASLETLVSYTDWDRLWYHLSGTVDFEDGVGRNLDSIQPSMGPDAIDSILSAEWIDQTALTPEVFWNDFETGDTSAWSSAAP